MDSVNRFALRVKLVSRMKRVSIDAVQACGMFLRDQLKFNGQIIKGCCTTSTGEKFTHYWVEDPDRIVYDVSMELAKLSNPELNDIEYTISNEVTTNTDEHNEELFKLYLEEPKKYWKMVQRMH
jgi:hypothetical protein